MSRPSGEPTVTVENHDGRFRLSLLPGRITSHVDRPRKDPSEPAISELFETDDAEATHRAWLSSEAAAVYNESVYCPYTSLKYHTLLVAALLDNYRRGIGYEELALVAEPPNAITPFRTVFAGERFTLRIDVEDNSELSARLGSRPWQSWASTWSRLPEHPLDTDRERFDMGLDAQLRRIQSWSTALQFVEDFERWRASR